MGQSNMLRSMPWLRFLAAERPAERFSVPHHRRQQARVRVITTRSGEVVSINEDCQVKSHSRFGQGLHFRAIKEARASPTLSAAASISLSPT